ncbi:MAG: bifunctional fucokinase/L-fucose-1-P-guanylyltransferase [Clostridia bacterium]|nr:bifunctional fucokinase/L-fucose-1-P-guanylyltransferase [Clostridia bacterium]
MLKYKNLFLRQSYIDSYSEYEKSLKKEKYPVWDYIVLTASNEAQAEFYRLQINARLNDGSLPSRTHYAVLPDPDGKRVGSGGATLNVLKYIAQQRNSNDFTGVKILCIHSGGDSKRVPQYSACGKLFSPVPRELPDGRRSTLFDEFIIGMTAVPARMSSGMLVCSGDVLLLFNPLQLDFYSKGAMALSIKENVETGKNHGVFLGNDKGNVERFLHKQSVEKLTECGAVDKNNNVNIDTGAVVFDGNLLNDLYSLVDTDDKFNCYVNDHVRLSFYADFLYPLAASSTLEDFYNETPEGEFSPELKRCREEIWDKLHNYKMRLLRFSPASFIHFGTTKELLKLMTKDMPEYSYLDWSANVNTNNKNTAFASSNSYISLKNAMVGRGSYIEDSYIHRNTTIGRGCVISGVTLNGQQIPDNTVLHGLKLKDGKFVVRMYGIDDNPKESSWMGKPLDEPLWTSKLFVPCDTMENALKATLVGQKSENALSLCDSFNMADTTAIPMWQAKLDDRVKVETILEAIDNRTSVQSLDGVFKSGLSKRIIDGLLKIADNLDDSLLEDFSKKIRIYYYLSQLVKDDSSEIYLNTCFDTICQAILKTHTSDMYNDSLKIAKNEIITRLPVRVNFGGGWSDTPPYCLENGGTVVNAAIKLNGKYPIEVEAKRLDEKKIVLTSTDNDSYAEFTSLAELQSCKDPSDPFALHKAALIAIGVIPHSQDVSFDEILTRIGGGIYLSTGAIDIPRGSGLGTSSILSAACIKGLSDFFGLSLNDEQICEKVIWMEQIMSTGGGWQDQMGGLDKGFKLVYSEKGIKQQVNSARLNIPDATIDELNKRYAIIYTGQRRLARNLLREVVGKYIGSNKEATTVLTEIQRLAIIMKATLEKGNLTAFAELLNAHWELSKKLDSGSTNTCIDQIFIAIEDLIDGKMICGAGGGGFLQVVMKRGITREDLKERLDSVFAGSGVEVWDCEFDV